jgi:hypothetical protein
MTGAMDFGIADDSECSRYKQTPQIAIALFADAAEPVLAPARVFFGTSPIQAKKLRLDRKVPGSLCRLGLVKFFLLRPCTVSST